VAQFLAIYNLSIDMTRQIELNADSISSDIWERMPHTANIIEVKTKPDY